MGQVHEPLSLVGVVTADVGLPRNDGSAGSGLYTVPIALNRRPTPDEAELIVAGWNRPPSFSTMHRSGIARVSGDRIVLDGTTVDEVAQYHAKTLKLVIDAVNSQAAASRSELEAERERAEARAAEHRRHVENVAQNIKFE